MSPYLALPLFACIASSIMATAIFCRGSKHRASRNTAWLLSGAAAVAAYQVLWNSQTGTVLAASLTVLASTVVWRLGCYNSKQLDPNTFAEDVLEALPDGVAMLDLDGRLRSGSACLSRATVSSSTTCTSTAPSWPSGRSAWSTPCRRLPAPWGTWPGCSWRTPGCP